MRNATSLAAAFVLTFSQEPSPLPAPVPRPPASGTESASPAPAIPRLGNAAAQLELAADLRRRLRGLEGAERQRARERLIAAYRAVRRFHPAESSAGAEATFRAGELLRSWDEPEAARAQFEEALALGRGTPFEARALFEIGHLERRARRPLAALDVYQRVLALEGIPARTRDAALLWSGRALAEGGRREEARRSWQRVADQGEDPLDRIEAFDELAAQLAHAGDLEGAAGVLERCREALSEAALEETEGGERVRNALLRMRAVQLIQRRVSDRAPKVRIDR